MLGDYVHQPQVVGEVASSPLTSLSRRSTYDEDSFFSQSKQKSENRTTQIARSPQHVQKLPTVHDKILRWFLEVIKQRQLKASACAGTASAFLFVFSVIMLQFSARSPLRFFKDAFFSFTSISTWASSICIGVFSVAVGWLLLNLLAKADQRQNVYWKNSETWIAFCAVLLYNLTYTFAIMNLTHFFVKNNFLVALLMACSILSALSTIYRTDFQLYFSGSGAQLGLIHTISGMFTLEHESVLASSIREAARILLITTSLGCVIGSVFLDWSCLLAVFNIPFHVYTVIVVSGQLFAAKALLKLARRIVMKPISFPLPPSFVVHTPTPEQTRTLTIALDTQDPLLKLFAFYDLRRVAWTDKSRRAETFSLSQPGGHPRNWKSVSAACINILERARVELQAASSRMENFGDEREYDLSDDDLVEVDREMLMMPMKARKQLYSSAVRQRHRMSMRQVGRRCELPQKQRSSWWKKFVANPPEQPLSRYDSNIVVLAIESLYMFVVESYNEDRYGVVLKDLAIILGVLVHLIQAVDRYFRLKANEVMQSANDDPVRKVESALQAALLRISGRFGKHMKDLDLTKEQFQTIKTVCQLET